MRTLPKSYEVKQAPAPDSLAQGKYLATIAGCHFCHTPIDDKSQPLPGMDFAGGIEFYLPNGRRVRTANLTPHPDTGIGAWEKSYFIGRFKEYADSTKSRIPISENGDNTAMPWLLYAGMTEKDLGAIYTYLMSVPLIDNAIEKYPKDVQE